MESAAYQETYGSDKVWERYRRNFANGRTYRRTRRSCIEVCLNLLMTKLVESSTRICVQTHWIALSQDGMLITNNPCPICRDEYFVVDYRNVKLISQFMEDYTGRVMTATGTGVCQHQWVQVGLNM